MKKQRTEQIEVRKYWEHARRPTSRAHIRGFTN